MKKSKIEGQRLFNIYFNFWLIYRYFESVHEILIFIEVPYNLVEKLIRIFLFEVNCDLRILMIFNYLNLIFQCIDLDNDGKLSFQDVSVTLSKHLGGSPDIYRRLWDRHVRSEFISIIS